MAEASEEEVVAFDDLGRFSSFQDWVNKARSRIDGDAICFDAKGRRCRIGADFMRADAEGTFPVYYTWDRLKAFRAVEYLTAALKDSANG
jgi:hypothetical protein